jgi:hypothetical protein
MGCIAFLDRTEGEMCSHILAVGRWNYIYVQAGETGFIATISYIEIERPRSLNPISGFAAPEEPHLQIKISHGPQRGNETKSPDYREQGNRHSVSINNEGFQQLNNCHLLKSCPALSEKLG